MTSPSFVQNRQTAWLLYNEGTTWHVRPSSLVSIEDPYTAFCFDQAINYWGRHIEGELDKIEDDKPQRAEEKRKARLQELLGTGDGKAATKGFADPAAMFR